MALIVVIPGESIGQSKVKRYEPSKTVEIVPGQPYEKFSTRDRFGREIVFYLSKAAVNQSPLPLISFVEGSGCCSRSEERDGKVRSAGGHIVVADVFREGIRNRCGASRFVFKSSRFVQPHCRRRSGNIQAAALAYFREIIRGNCRQKHFRYYKRTPQTQPASRNFCRRNRVVLYLKVKTKRPLISKNAECWATNRCKKQS